MKANRETDRLSPEKITRKMGSSPFAKNIVFREKVNSTNVLAKDLALKGAPEGTIVITEEQTAGKGRIERRWLSPGYKNLLFSILLRPILPVDNVFIMTMILAVAVIDEIKEKSELNVLIKWPNDLCVNRKKIGGILTEFSVKEKRLEYLILGLGLNVNWSPEEDVDLMYPATSILAESGQMVSRNEMLSGILKRFEKDYQKAISGNSEDLYMRWNKLSIVIEKDVEIISQDEVIRGRVLRIDRQGALILKNNLGEEKMILSGDVSLRLR